MERTADAAGGALGVERARLGDRARVQREHRPQRDAAAIVERLPRQIVAHDILGRRLPARHGVLQLADGFLDHGEHWPPRAHREHGG